MADNDLFPDGPTFTVDPTVEYQPTGPNAELSRQLRTQEELDRFAVANAQDNELANEEFARDLRELSYGEMYFKYGREVANDRARLAAAERNREDKLSHDNTLRQDAGDFATGVANAMYRGVGLAVQGYGYLEGALDGDPNTTGRSRAAEYADAHNRISSGMAEPFHTEEFKDRQYYEGIASSLDAEDRQAKYEQEIADGASPFWAGVRREGQGVLDVAGRIGSNPMIAADITAQGVGSLAVSAPLGGAGGLAAKGATGLVVKNALAQKVALAAGTSAGAGSLEVSGAFSEGVSEMMDMPQEELDKSPIYQQLLNEGATPQEARIQLAGLVAETSAIRSAPAAFALGFLTNRFERMPLNTFAGEGVTKGLLQIAGEGIEEAGQGVAQTIAKNTAVASETGLERDAFEGVGEEAALGFVGGIGTAGAAASPAATIGTGKAAVKSVTPKKKVTYNDPLRNDILNGPGFVAEAAKSTGQAASKAVGDVLDAADPLVTKAKKASEPVVQKVSEAVAPVVDKVAELADKPTTKATKDQAVAARRTEIVADREIEADKELKNESLAEAAVAPDEELIPESLQDVANNDQSVLKNTVGVIRKLASGKPTQEEKVYVSAQLAKVRGMMDTMPKKLKTEVGRLLNTEAVKRLQKEASEVDLKTEYDETTEITPDVVSNTVKIARQNPANVNPVVAQKILEMSDNNVSKEDVRLMKIAAEIAEIADVRTDEDTSNKVSQSIRKTGYTNKKGENLRSANDFAADIFAGAQAKDGKVVLEDGQKIPVTKVVTSFRNLVEHMNNKVNAVNESIARADGQPVQFRTLSRGVKFLDPGQAGASSITIHTGNENSMKLAADIKEDAARTQQIYDKVVEAYPELFKGVADIPVVAEPEATTIVEEDSDAQAAGSTETEAEGDTRLQSEINEDSQVDFIVNAFKEDQKDQDYFGDPANREAIEAFDNYILKSSREDIVKIGRKAIAQGVEYEYLEGTIFDTLTEADTQFETAEEFEQALKNEEGTGDLFENAEQNENVEETEQEQGSLSVDNVDTNFDGMDEKELMASAQSHDQDIKLSELSKEESDKLEEVLSPLIYDLLKLPDDIIRLIVKMDGLSATHKGQAYWAERVIALSPDMITELTETLSNPNFNEVPMIEGTGLHVFLHELSHIIDAYGTDQAQMLETLQTNSMKHAEYDAGDGAFYLEIYETQKKSEAVKQYFEYPMGFNDPDVVSSEIFAQTGALVLYSRLTGLPNPFGSVLPKGIAYAEKQIDAISQTDGEATFVTAAEETSAAGTETATETQEVIQDRSERNINAEFDRIYTANDEGSPITNLDGFRELAADADMNTSLMEKFENIVPFLVEAMNDRLASMTMSRKDKTKVVDAYKENADIAKYGKLKNLMIVDPKTGQYDQNMLELVAIAVFDWMTTVSSPDPQMMDKHLEYLGMTRSDLRDDEHYEAVMFGLDSDTVASDIAHKIKKIWGVKDNPDSELHEYIGVAENLAKEMIMAMSTQDDGLVKVKQLPMLRLNEATNEMEEVQTQTIFVRNLRETMQEDIEAARTADSYNNPFQLLFGEKKVEPSIGEPVTTIANTQNRGNIRLSKLERDSLRNQQNTGHTMDVGKVEFFSKLEAILPKILGFTDDVDNIKNKALRLSKKGKNDSVMKMIRDVAQLYGRMQDDLTQPVYYQLGIGKNGRTTYQGPNPQANKLLRTSVTPTWSTFSFDDQNHLDKFWLTVAQAAGLNKTENEDHAEILKDIQTRFMDKFGDLKDMIKDSFDKEEVDLVAFEQEIKDTLGFGFEPAELAAIYAVAEMEAAKAKGQSSWETSLSYELDGKTNGAANMMVNFGQGEISPEEFSNFQRIGLYLGNTFKSMNEFFSQGNRDLYEVTADESQTEYYRRLAQLEDPDKVELLKAAGNLNARLGTMQWDEDEQRPVMVRNTAKNPMTKVNYGAGDLGVGIGLGDEIILGIYQAMQGMEKNANLDEVIYNGFLKDVETMFGAALPDEIDETFEFPKWAVKNFQKNMKTTLGSVLTDTTKDVLGSEVKEFNDLLVFSTNVQNEYLRAVFDKKLDEAVKKAGKKGVRNLTKREYEAVVKEMELLAPLVVSEDQTLAIGGFERQRSNLVLSQTMDEQLNQKTRLKRPEENVGVRGIPYVIIGSGDAMMMNLIFGQDYYPRKAINVFDGFDIAASEIDEYGQLANRAVLKSWDRDVAGMVSNNFNSFLNGVEDQDALKKAFIAVKGKSKNSTVTAKDPKSLAQHINKRVREIQVRKEVLKETPMTVDQMGGSGEGYVRGKNDTTTLTEINRKIKSKLNQKPKVTKDESYGTLVVGNTKALMKTLDKSLKGEQRKALHVIRKMVPDTDVVLGSLDQLNEYRQANYPDDGMVLDAAAHYDAENNVLFIAKKGTEAALHELIHAATYNRVLSHYDGTTPSDAVHRMETLMEEFMAMDFDTQSLRNTQAAILKAKRDQSPSGQAAALNEFMAYVLSNQDTINKTKDIRIRSLKDMGKKLIALLQKLMGNVPRDMWSHVMFNTKLLQDIPDRIPLKTVDDGGNDGNTGGNDGNGNDGGGSDSTPSGPSTPIDRYTNYWIDLLRERFAGLRQGTVSDQRKAKRYWDNAEEVIVDLVQGGFSFTNREMRTFRAIHMVLAAEAQLEPKSLLALHKAYNHVVKNLSPESFGTGQIAQERYSAVMEALGGTSNDENISDAVAVMLAMSQTNQAFRDALETLPIPEGATEESLTLGTHLNNMATFVMHKAVGTLSTEEAAQDVLDNLSKSIIVHDQSTEFGILQRVTRSFDTADAYLSGKLSEVAEAQGTRNEEIVNGHRSRLTKNISRVVTAGTAVLDADRAEAAAKGAKEFTHMGISLDGFFTPIREFVTEIIGTDEFNKNFVALLDKVNYAASSARQAYREDVPVILQNQFENSPTTEQWSYMFETFAKTGMTLLVDPARFDTSMRLLGESAFRSQKIQEAENALAANYNPDTADAIKAKAMQLADYMNDKGAGHMLLKNAYAIAKNHPNFQESMVPVIDELVSLYALDTMNAEARTEADALYQADPKGVKAMITYIQGLEAEEEAKPISELARLNGYKGYIPNIGNTSIRIIIDYDSSEEALKLKGYTKLESFNGDVNSVFPRSYYVTNVRQQGNYSQGIMQNIAHTYRGVDATSGLTVNGTTSTIVKGDGVPDIVDELQENDEFYQNKTQNLIPVLDGNNDVIAFERTIDPELMKAHYQQKQNLAVMLGAWAGRQVEEKAANAYNRQLVDMLKESYDNREPGTDNMFIDLSDDELKDPIYRESYKLIPQDIKDYADSVFGAEGFMVRKDMVNLAVGYREPSVTDLWSGKTRLPKPMRDATKVALRTMFRGNEYKWLSLGEEGLQTAVSTAKDIIVVRSLIVPAANLKANVIQLMTRGVPIKAVTSGFRNKLAEIEKYNENVKRLIEIEVEIQLAGNNVNQIRILEQERQSIQDLTKRMSIAPIIEAGAYKNLSEGLTELDASITSGKIGEYVEKLSAKLPKGVNTGIDYALVNRSSKIYQVSNRAVQYGDFIGKSIYYDHLISKGLSKEEAISKMNEEFVNFSVPQGRTRSGLESNGLSWFLAFKIRIAKIAMQMMRENPVRALAVNGVLPVEDSPVQDNLFSVAAQGNLDYALGYEMLFGAPELNPWMQMMDW